jgi:hypothetical protein
VFSVRLPKNIKSSTFEKASKSSRFRPDNQRQISLDLSHTCRVQKRLISLINSATFFEIISLARCEYSKLVSVYSFSKGSVLVFEEECTCIQRGVSVSLLIEKTFSSRNETFEWSLFIDYKWSCFSCLRRIREILLKNEYRVFMFIILYHSLFSISWCRLLRFIK